MMGAAAKNHVFDLLLMAIAPAIRGSTYIVTTAFLPGFSPLTVAVLRALPAGMLLLPATFLFAPMPQIAGFLLVIGSLTPGQRFGTRSV